MKTEEDEAFEDIERRQSGFYTKRQMAMHKTQDQHICRHYKQWQHCHICDLEAQVAELKAAQEPWNEDEWRRNNWRCGHGWLRGEQCEICNAAQEPPSEWAGIKAILDEYGLQAIDFVADFKAALAQSAQEQEEDWGALAEKQLASIKRDTQASFEDAMVRATHQLMVEVEAKLRSKNT